MRPPLAVDAVGGATAAGAAWAVPRHVLHQVGQSAEAVPSATLRG